MLKGSQVLLLFVRMRAIRDYGRCVCRWVIHCLKRQRFDKLGTYMETHGEPLADELLANALVTFYLVHVSNNTSVIGLFLVCPQFVRLTPLAPSHQEEAVAITAHRGLPSFITHSGRRWIAVSHPGHPMKCAYRIGAVGGHNR